MIQQKSDDESEEDIEMADESKENLEIDKLNLKEDSVFELKINNDKQASAPVIDDTVVVTSQAEAVPFSPLPRRNAYLQLHKGYLYLYGGCFEGKNGKEFTLTDMYCLNLKKLDEWKTLIEDKAFKKNDLNALKQMEEAGRHF